MAFELIKRPVTLCKGAGKVEVEDMVENDIIVPDTKPDIFEIIMLDNDVIITEKEISEGKLKVQGQILYRIVYKADNSEKNVECIWTKAPFSISCNIPADANDIKTKIKAIVEHTDYNLLNERKLNIKSVVKVICKIVVCYITEVGMRISGEETEQKSEKMKMNNIIDFCEDKISADEKINLPSDKPPIKEILAYTINISEKGYTISGESIYLKFGIRLFVVYKADSEYQGYETYNTEVEIKKEFPVEAYDNSIYEIGYELNNIEIYELEDIDGLNTMLNLKIEMSCHIWAYREEEIDILTDAYGLQNTFDLDKKNIETYNKINKYIEEINLRETINIEEKDENNIEETYLTVCKPFLDSYVFENKEFLLNGRIKCTLLYSVGIENREMRSVNLEIPFEEKFLVDESEIDAEYDFDLAVENVEESIVSDRDVELNIRLKAIITIRKMGNVQIITEILNVKEIEKKEFSGITIYFIQPKDTLWDIAKKYLTTKEKLIKINQLDEGQELVTGRKIFI